MGAEPLCILRNCALPLFEDGQHGVLPPVPGAISYVPELVEYLRVAATRPPHMVRMDLPGRLCAWVAIGGPWAAIDLQHLLSEGQQVEDVPPAWRALAHRPPPIDPVAFLTDGSRDVMEIESEYLLPAEEVIQIAAHVAAHRTLARAHTWVTHDYHGTPIYAGRDRPWENWDKPLPRPVLMEPIDVEPGPAPERGGM